MGASTPRGDDGASRHESSVAPTTVHDSDVARDGRRTAVVIAISGSVRLLVAALTPVFPDETYYWDWSRHLATGYYDHPPMIAWLIRLGTSIFGHTALGVRIGAVVAGALATGFASAAARRLGGERAGFLTAVLFAVTPLSAAGLVLATPDAPLLAAATACLYALVRVFETPPRSAASTMWWSIAGVALGLAFCSKLTSALLPLGVFAGLLITSTLRPRLAELGPYLATIIALAMFLPVIVWNAQHQWISFAFQLQHGLGGTSGSAVKRELDLIGGQAGLVSPIVFVLCIAAVARALRRATVPAERLLGLVSIVIFAFFVYSATQRRVEANWPALAFVPAILLVAAFGSSGAWSRWLRPGIVLAGLLSLVAYVNAFTPILPVPARRDPAARASGWPELAAAVSSTRASLPLAPARVHIAAARYQEASALAFHLTDHPDTYSLNISGRANQYDLWPGFNVRARPGDAMLLVVDDGVGPSPTVNSLTAHFSSVQRGSQVQLTRNGDLVKNLRIWLLDGWRGTWPPSRLRSRT